MQRFRKTFARLELDISNICSYNIGNLSREVVSVDTRQKVEALGRAAKYDLCGEACGTEANRVRDDLDRWIYPAVLPDGKRVKLLKILLTNACENDC